MIDDPPPPGKHIRRIGDCRKSHLATDRSPPVARDQRRLEETTAELAGEPAPVRHFGGSLRKDIATVKRIRELRRSQARTVVRAVLGKATGSADQFRAEWGRPRLRQPHPRGGRGLASTPTPDRPR
ncbi:hypothetical protein Aau02nite_32970 [Amorphoplanes auranticolor]|uniref:Uncharacterized protein n=1 Tax=Actinoplanes auranticolor TaxID=47988 RepID=A0A919SBG3_9ACTN|nr:hypothetical protein Aau02nite_32970 [Actinoplanes auranticolor]